MKKLIFIAFYLVSIHVAAQNELWYPGAVVTVADEVIVGEILLHPQYDLLVIRQGDSRLVLTASKLKSIRYFDEGSNINRKFVVLSDNQNQRERKIYEVILFGAVPVLRRAKNTFTVTSSNADGYNYYFVRDEKIRSVRKFRSNLYPDIKKFLKNEERILHLNPNHTADAIRFIELYNQFSSIMALR